MRDSAIVERNAQNSYSKSHMDEPLSLVHRDEDAYRPDGQGAANNL
jgi:hypothetical protein